MVIRIDSTAAKIGRSMKKCEKRIRCSQCGRERRDGGLGSRLLAVTGSGGTVAADQSALSSAGWISPWRGATVAPGRTNGLARPVITTRSVGVRPGCDDAQSARHAAECHRLGDTLLSAPTISTILLAWSETIAASGISKASIAPP